MFFKSRTKLTAALTIVAAVISGPVMAQTPAHCAQRVLAATEFDPGVIDGRPGRGTEAASVGYLSAHPEVDLPPLTMTTSQMWCDAFDEAAVLYGTPFTIGGDLVTKFFAEGVYEITTRPFSGTYAIRGMWGNHTLDMSGVRQELTDEDLAWPALLLTPAFYPEQFGYQARSDMLDADFILKLAEPSASTYKVVMPFTNGETRTDIVFVGMDGVHRGVVFFTAAGMDRPDSYYQVASSETWTRLDNLENGADWVALGVDPAQFMN